MINILIADDHRLFRETLTYMLNSREGFRVIAQCMDSTDAIDLIREEKPDIVLMDINIQPISGIEATEKICSFSSSKVIGLSVYAQSSFAKKMIRVGASGYVTKNSSREEIFNAVEEVAKGNKYICSEIKNIVSEELLNNQEEQPHVGLLTGREIQIVNYISAGLSSKEIASSINIALKTVEVHRHNILKKLKLRNSSNLVNFFYENAGYLF